jgi:hypothetical protein
VLGSLERSYRALTGEAAIKTGADYRRYNTYLQGLQTTHGLSPHAFDVFLMVAAKQAKHEDLEDQQVVKEEYFGGFSLESFEFLSELAANNNDEWFTANKKRFGAKVREPIRELIASLGERFVDAVCPELERTAKSPQTLGNIRKNAFGATTNVYWRHYWGAFHRRELTRAISPRWTGRAWPESEAQYESASETRLATASSRRSSSPSCPSWARSCSSAARWDPFADRSVSGCPYGVAAHVAPLVSRPAHLTS